LAARFGAQPPAAQRVPGGFFSLGLAVAQFADALGWDAHRQSITALARISWAVEVIGELTPHQPAGRSINRQRVSAFPSAGVGPSRDRPKCRNSRRRAQLCASWLVPLWPVAHHYSWRYFLGTPSVLIAQCLARVAARSVGSHS
jgi:hypothetical protein